MSPSSMLASAEKGEPAPGSGDATFAEPSPCSLTRPPPGGARTWTSFFVRALMLWASIAAGGGMFYAGGNVACVQYSWEVRHICYV